MQPMQNHRHKRDVSFTPLLSSRLSPGAKYSSCLMWNLICTERRGACDRFVSNLCLSFRSLPGPVGDVGSDVVFCQRSDWVLSRSVSPRSSIIVQIQGFSACFKPEFLFWAFGGQRSPLGSSRVSGQLNLLYFRLNFSLELHYNSLLSTYWAVHFTSFAKICSFESCRLGI